MNPHDYEMQLAAWLGDEMTPAERAAFEQACAADPERARELDELHAMRRELRGTIPSPAVARAVTTSVGHFAGAPRVVRRPAAAWFGYAAAVLLAFTAGYALRGWESAAPGSPTLASDVSPGDPAPMLAATDEDLVRRFLEVSKRQPHATTLSRAWLALASK